MKQPGQIVLFKFPQSDLAQGKSRPALLLGKLPGPYDDWLVCMISTQMRHYIQSFDEIIQLDDPDFSASGLKEPSLVRVGRLAVVNGDILLGAIGKIDSNRLQRVKMNLATWIRQTQLHE